ncbi:MAG: crossover junction endodeoxyribonuclease RuvC [Parcubacteria group bacterium]|nr:crossover junction endodeoxyribonuclease RuvC [Parcubacteria group bacterium]
MIILGIDPGTATTGFGLIERKGDKAKYIKCGCITTGMGMPMSERISCIYDDISALIKEYKPAAAAVEELFFFKNAKTVITVAQARGAILLAIQKAGLPLGEYTPLQIKQSLTGYGRADKAQMQQMVKSMLGLNKIPKPDDAADALAVAICHANSERLNNLCNKNL